MQWSPDQLRVLSLITSSVTAPTVLDLLGLPRPAHMTGRSIFSGDGEAA